MKKILLTLSIAALGLAATASNGIVDNTARRIPYAVQQAFQREFGQQPNVKWQVTREGIMKASFVTDDQATTAFFDNSANWVATSTAFTLEQLPAKTRSKVKSLAENGGIEDLFKLDTREESAYYVQIGKNGQSIVYKVYENGYAEQHMSRKK